MFVDEFVEFLSQYADIDGFGFFIDVFGLLYPLPLSCIPLSNRFDGHLALRGMYVHETSLEGCEELPAAPLDDLGRIFVAHEFFDEGIKFGLREPVGPGLGDVVSVVQPCGGARIVPPPLCHDPCACLGFGLLAGALTLRGSTLVGLLVPCP